MGKETKDGVDSAATVTIVKVAKKSKQSVKGKSKEPKIEEESSELTEQQLNIEIIKLRKCVKQVSGKLIQSLVRKARKYQKDVEKYPKNQQRSKLQLEIISDIKGLGGDAVVKFAISHSKEVCHAILSSESADKSLKAYARMANEEILRQSIEKLSKKFTNWEQVTAKFQNEPGLEKKKKFSKPNKKPESVKKAATTPKTAATASPKSTKKSKVEVKEKKEVATLNKSEVVVKEKSKSAVVKKLQSLSDLEQLESGPGDGKFEGGKSLSEALLKKDSFFLSSDGQEVSSEEEQEVEEESEDEFQDQSYQSRKYHIRNREDNDSKPQKSFQGSNDRRNSTRRDHNQGPPRKDFSNGKKEFVKEYKKPVEAEPVKLHPSWEAKKRQSTIQISNAPQNKKIKFD